MTACSFACSLFCCIKYMCNISAIIFLINLINHKMIWLNYCSEKTFNRMHYFLCKKLFHVTVFLLEVGTGLQGLGIWPSVRCNMKEALPKQARQCGSSKKKTNQKPKNQQNKHNKTNRQTDNNKTNQKNTKTKQPARVGSRQYFMSSCISSNCFQKNMISASTKNAADRNLSNVQKRAAGSGSDSQYQQWSQPSMATPVQQQQQLIIASLAWHTENELHDYCFHHPWRSAGLGNFPAQLLSAVSPKVHKNIDITSRSSVFLVRIYRCHCKILHVPYNLTELSVQCKNIIMKQSKKYSRHTPIVNLLTTNRTQSWTKLS